MNAQPNIALFGELSSQQASQVQGGHWAGGARQQPAVTAVRVRFYPGTTGYGGVDTINITNPVFDDGSIVNFPGGGGSGINVTNPHIDDGASVGF